MLTFLSVVGAIVVLLVLVPYLLLGIGTALSLAIVSAVATALAVWARVLQSASKADQKKTDPAKDMES